MGRGQARSPSPPALGTMPSPHPRHRQAARLPLPYWPLPLVSFLSLALPGASCRPLLFSFAWSSSVPWPLPSTPHASFCSASGSVSSLAWKVYMAPYPAFCLQRELNGFVGLVGVEEGEEEGREKGAGGESKKGSAYPRVASEASAQPSALLGVGVACVDRKAREVI